MAASRKPLPNKPVVAAVAEVCHVPSHARLALGLSGGLDSVVLRVLLAARSTPLYVRRACSPRPASPRRLGGFLRAVCASLQLNKHPSGTIARDDVAESSRCASRTPAHVAALDALLLPHQQGDRPKRFVQLLRGAGEAWRR
jgi:hypothetical protein